MATVDIPAPPPAMRAPRAAPFPPRIPLTIAVFSALLCIYTLLDVDSPFRPIIYVVPVALLIECRLKTNRSFLKPGLGLAAGLVILSMTISFAFLGSVHKEAVFIALSLVCAFVRAETSKWDIYVLLAISTVVVVALAALNGFSLRELLLGYGAESYKVSVESSLGLAVGLVTILAYYNRWWGLGIASLLLTVLFGKRVVIAALAIAFAVDLVMRLTRTRDARLGRAIACAVVVAIAITMSLNTGEFYTLLSNLLREYTGLNVNADFLSSGRYLNMRAFEHYVHARSSLFTDIFGHGIGYSTSVLEDAIGRVLYRHYPLLHNDWMRIFTDYGYIGLFLVAGAMVVASYRSRMLLMASLYTAVLFITDNVFSYFYYWFFFLISVVWISSAKPRARVAAGFWQGQPPSGQGPVPFNSVPGRDLRAGSGNR